MGRRRTSWAGARFGAKPRRSVRWRGPPDQGISDGRISQSAPSPDPASSPASAQAIGGKTSIANTCRSRPRSTPRGTQPTQACALGAESSPPLERLGRARAGDGFSDHMPISSKAREQFAASIGAVRPVEQLGRCLIDPLDDPLDRRLDNLGNGSASAPALLSTLPAGFEFGGLSLVNKIVDRVGGVLHVLL